MEGCRKENLISHSISLVCRTLAHLSWIVEGESRDLYSNTAMSANERTRVFISKFDNREIHQITFGRK
jgi:hypothetical protein